MSVSKISVTKAKVKVQGKVQVVGNKDKHHRALDKYNYLRVKFQDEVVHFLMTDFELNRAKDRANKNPEDLPEVSWLRSFIFSAGATSSAEIIEVINTRKLPAAAHKYSHVYVNLVDTDENVHLLFTDAEIKSFVDRASKNPEDLPKKSVWNI